MKILVTNDDGIHAEGLWALVRELKKIAKVTVVAPDGERSAIGTAVTLLQPLHASEVCAPEDGVKAYAIDGSPSDCVILALGKLIEDKVDIVVSGINPGLNLGEDVYISGTVGAAMQGYFRGLPALAVSALSRRQAGTNAAAIVAARLVEKMAANDPTRRVFLNMNAPDLPLKEIRGVKITRLARSSHINSVTEDNNDQYKQYRLVRERVTESGSDGTDIQAVEQGYISITPLYTSLLDKPPQRLLKKLCTELSHEFKKQ
ncbi:MAG: 5'/3'-nucleotidase SurE [Chloroflexi bacterium RBG_16_50_11]|nr:MAG: 5'/3'-nucleotidase SurE [Chloroflexi bacterium RBG_16_50_11]